MRITGDYGIKIYRTVFEETSSLNSLMFKRERKKTCGARGGFCQSKISGTRLEGEILQKAAAGCAGADVCPG